MAGLKTGSLCGSSVTVSELENRCGLATMGVRPSVPRIEIAADWASVRFVAMVDRCVTIDYGPFCGELFAIRLK